MFKSSRKITTVTLALIISALTFAACDDDSSGTDTDLTILEMVETESDLSSLETILSEQELSGTLSQESPMTIFAPTNDALAKEDLSDKSDEEIQSLLKYHIVASALNYEALQDTESVETLNSDSLYFESSEGEVTINSDQAVITAEGMEATNGMVFKVDTLLTPVE